MNTALVKLLRSPATDEVVEPDVRLVMLALALGMLVGVAF